MLTRRDILTALGAPACRASWTANFTRGLEGDTSWVQAKINAAARSGAPARLGPGTYRISSLRIPSNTNIEAAGCNFLPVEGSMNEPVILISGRNIVLRGNIVVHLSNKRSTALMVDAGENVRVDANVSVLGPAKPGEKGFNGGLLVQSSTNIYIKSIETRGVHQRPPGPGLYRSLGVRFSNKIRVDNIHADDGDMCVGLFSCENVQINRVEARRLTDNGIYLDGDTRDVYIRQAVLENVEEGLVLYCHRPDTGVHISELRVSHATNKGISLRTGGGYRIDSVELDRAVVGQSPKFSGVTGLTISRLIFKRVPHPRKALHIGHATGLSIGHVFADDMDTVKYVKRLNETDKALISAASILTLRRSLQR